MNSLVTCGFSYYHKIYCYLVCGLGIGTLLIFIKGHITKELSFMLDQTSCILPEQVSNFRNDRESRVFKVLK
jgi:hypothetical protein